MENKEKIYNLICDQTVRHGQCIYNQKEIAVLTGINIKQIRKLTNELEAEGKILISKIREYNYNIGHYYDKNSYKAI